MRERTYDYDAVYDFIVKYKSEHDGVGPGIVEISEAFQIKSYNSVVQILDRLVQDWKITLGPGARMIYVTGAEWNAPTKP